MKKILIGFLSLISMISIANAKISVIAAENQYGSVAEMIGGDKVDVTSIITNADGDPHSFVASVKNATLLENADVIIYNGADYDTWINSIVKNNKKAKIVAAQDLLNYISTDKYGINPHLWYQPETFPKMAEKLTNVFSSLDPENSEYFRNNLENFQQQYNGVYSLVDEIKEKYKDTPVTATEPLFGYMANALGLNMYGLNFQWVIMNDSEPSPRLMIEYQELFNNNIVKVLFYNEQVTDNITKNILSLAKKNNIQIVGLTETMPTDKNAISWMIDTLNKTKEALEKTQNNQ
nr:zinc ABC transporter substrate-binding protein [Pseudofrancisella aestuarii]